ncbi:hypothetical protein [Providencia stuartii]|uniref:hypothetical protein n=1 Tax=Providencia stuartii TaxID=588 RepID=UPI00111D9060|nr:hypothetical protein [Providencia stuartii]
MAKIILFLIFISFNAGASKIIDKEFKKYDYKIGINLKECGMEFYINDVELIYNSDMKTFDTTFGIGSFLKKNNKLTIVFFSLNETSLHFSDDTNCSFNFLVRNRFNSNKMGSVGFVNYNPTNDISYNMKQALSFKNLNVEWIELQKSPTLDLINNDNNKFYMVDQDFKVISDFPEWKWVNSFQFDNNIKYFNELPHEQQVKLKEVYSNLWSAMNEQDDTKLKELYAEMLEESSAADGGSVDSYYNSLGFSRLFDKEEFELQPLKISATSKISKYLDNRVISVFSSPVYFKHLESGQSVGVNPKLRFDGDKFIITR